MPPAYGSDIFGDYVEFRAADYINTGSSSASIVSDSSPHNPSVVLETQTFQRGTPGDFSDWGGETKTVVGLTGFTRVVWNSNGVPALWETEVFNSTLAAQILVRTFVNGVDVATTTTAAIEGDYWLGTNPATYHNTPVWADFSTYLGVPGNVIPIIPSAFSHIRPGDTVDLALSFEAYPSTIPGWVEPTFRVDRMRFYFAFPTNVFRTRHRSV